MHGISAVITLNITEVESLDFPRILRQKCNTQRFFQAWNAILSNLMTFAWYQDNWKNHFMSQYIKKSSLHFEKKVLLWMKIMIWHTFQNPNMEFPDISLTFAPFQNFPDIISNSLTIPWPWKNKNFPWLFPDVWQPWDSNPGISGTQFPADWMHAHTATELSRIT